MAQHWTLAQLRTAINPANAAGKTIRIVFPRSRAPLKQTLVADKSPVLEFCGMRLIVRLPASFHDKVRELARRD
jgi:hypothetical protein